MGSCAASCAVLTTRVLQAVLLELARARVHGFSQAEVDAACRRLMSDFETTYLERDQVRAVLHSTHTST